MSTDRSKYRDHLVQADQKSQEDFDKTLITLSSGGLGVSIVFLKDFVRELTPAGAKLLLTGWMFWTLSLTCVLFSFYLSRFALRKAIKQLDDDEIDDNRAGGNLSRVVEIINGLGGLFFVFGVFCIVCFAYGNIKK